MNRVVGEFEVGGEFAEKVDGKRRRPQQVGPEALVVEALVRLDEGRPCARRFTGFRSEKACAGRAGIVERKSAADRA